MWAKLKDVAVKLGFSSLRRRCEDWSFDAECQRVHHGPAPEAALLRDAGALAGLLEQGLAELG